MEAPLNASDTRALIGVLNDRINRCSERIAVNPDDMAAGQLMKSAEVQLADLMDHFQVPQDPQSENLQQGLSVGRRCRFHHLGSHAAIGRIVGFGTRGTVATVQLPDGHCSVVPIGNITPVATGAAAVEEKDVSGGEEVAGDHSGDGERAGGSMAEAQRRWEAITTLALTLPPKTVTYGGRQYLRKSEIFPLLRNLMDHNPVLFPQWRDRCEEHMRRALSGLGKQAKTNPSSFAADHTAMQHDLDELVPFKSILAIALHPSNWMTQVRAPVHPLGTDAQPYVFLMTPPAPGTPCYAGWKTAVDRAKQLLKWVCNCCNTNMHLMLCLVDRQGPITTGCIAGNRSAWAAAIIEAQRQMMQNAVFFPLFFNEARDRFVPAPCTSGVSYGGDTMFYHPPAAGTEVSLFPALIFGPDNFPRIDKVPATHVCLGQVGPAAPPNEAAFFSWPPHLQLMLEAVDLYAPSLQYMRTGLQYVRRLAGALDKMKIPAKLVGDARVAEQTRQLLLTANAWATVAGQTTSVSEAEADVKGREVSLRLEWRTPHAQRDKKVFDLDYVVYVVLGLETPTSSATSSGTGETIVDLSPPSSITGNTVQAPTGHWSCPSCTFFNTERERSCHMCGKLRVVASVGGGGGGGSSTGTKKKKKKVQIFKVSYESTHKYLCTACEKHLSPSSGGVCRAITVPPHIAEAVKAGTMDPVPPGTQHGVNYTISFVEDARHSVGQAVEAVKIGGLAKAKISVCFRNYDSITSVATSGARKEGPNVVRHVFAKSVMRIGKRTIHGTQVKVPRNPAGKKVLYEGTGIVEALAAAAGYGEAEAAELGEEVEAVPIEEAEVTRRLARGAFISLPLSEEFFDDNNVRRLTPEEVQAAHALVTKHFGGEIGAEGVNFTDPLLANKVLWRADDVVPPEGKELDALRTCLGRTGLDPAFVTLITTGSAAYGGIPSPIDFPSAGQRHMAPSFVLRYTLNGEPLPSKGRGSEWLAYATWHRSSSLPRSGTAPFGHIKATGMFTTKEWNKTVLLRGLPGATSGPELFAISRMPNKSLFMHVRPSPVGQVPAPHSYPLDMPTEPLVPYVGDCANRKQMSRSVQQLRQPVRGGFPAFGFVAQPGTFLSPSPSPSPLFSFSPSFSLRFPLLHTPPHTA